MKRILSIILLVAGCTGTDAKSCPDGCGLGQTCDTSLGVCTAKTFPAYPGEPPGRGVSIASIDTTVFAGVVDPKSRTVLAGVLGPDGAQLVALGPVSLAAERVIVRTSQSTVFVAWLAPNSQYRVASRPAQSNNSRWAIEELSVDGTDYVGGPEFDFAVGQESGLYLAFQDRDRTLRLLSKIQNAYAIELVDDGGPSANGFSCPDSLRGADAPAGVGVSPSIALNSVSLAIAYQDADCGDLRVARRAESEFGVDVVDTGSLEGEPTPMRRGRVGKYASARYEPDTGRLFVAYLDQSRARLMLAVSNEGGEFDLEVVDSGLTLDAFSRERRELIGAFAHLSFGPRGEPSITHMNTTQTEIRFSQRPSGSGLWFHKTLRGDGLVGFSTTHVFVPSMGLVAAAERLVPGPDGLTSTLEVVWP